MSKSIFHSHITFVQIFKTILPKNAIKFFFQSFIESKLLLESVGCSLSIKAICTLVYCAQSTNCSLWYKHITRDTLRLYAHLLDYQSPFAYGMHSHT